MKNERTIMVGEGKEVMNNRPEVNQLPRETVKKLTVSEAVIKRGGDNPTKMKAPEAFIKGSDVNMSIENKAKEKESFKGEGQEKWTEGILFANKIATNYESLSDEQKKDLSKRTTKDKEGKDVSVVDAIKRLHKELAEGKLGEGALDSARLAGNLLEGLEKSDKDLYDTLTKDLGDGDKSKGDGFIKDLGEQVKKQTDAAPVGEADKAESISALGVTDKEVTELVQYLTEPTPLEGVKTTDVQPEPAGSGKGQEKGVSPVPTDKKKEASGTTGGDNKEKIGRMRNLYNRLRERLSKVDKKTLLLFLIIFYFVAMGKFAKTVEQAAERTR